MAKNTKNQEQAYTADSMRELTGLEPIRQSPSQYIGDTLAVSAKNGRDNPGTDETLTAGGFHLFVETLGNSSDEATNAGADGKPYANLIEIRLHADQSITVTDNGRGVPPDINKTTGKSGLEITYLTMNAGGKFKSRTEKKAGNYKTAQGLHGVGAACVAALSDRLDVTVWRNGNEYRMSAKEGIPGVFASDKIRSKFTPITDSSKVVTKSKDNRPSEIKNEFPHGTSVHWHPDPKIWGGTDIPWKDIYDYVNAQSYMAPTCTYRIIDETALGHGTESKPKVSEFHHPGGIADMITEKTEKGVNLSPMISFDVPASYMKNVVIENEDGTMGTEEIEYNCAVKVAMRWTNRSGADIEGYANGVHCSGKHIDGFRRGISRGVGDWIKSANLMTKQDEKKGISPNIDDITDGMVAVVEVLLEDQCDFHGQTKDVLGNSEVLSCVSDAVKDKVGEWFNTRKNAANAKKIGKSIIESARLRAKQKAERETAKKVKSALGGLGGKPAKLCDCRHEGPGTELLICEGQSAGGTIKQARDASNQAAYFVRGVGLNSWGAADAKILANKEFADLVSSMRAGGIGKNFNYENRRYDRIGIYTDADEDGKNIASLLLVFIYTQFPSMIENKKVFIGCPPLYSITYKSGPHKGETIFAADESERDTFMDDFTSNGGDVSQLKIARAKGLGEMNPDEFRPCLDPRTRKVRIVTVDDVEDARERAKYALSLLFSGKKEDKEARRVWIDDTFDADIDDELIDNIDTTSGKNKKAPKAIKTSALKKDDKRDWAVNYADGGKDVIQLGDEILTSMKSFIDYTLTDRALPYIDGLKPVHRATLWYMWDHNIKSTSNYVKSQTIAGGVIGTLHPHSGDAAYGAAAGLARSGADDTKCGACTLNSSLIDGHGNFGASFEDGPAAPRYCVTGDTLINTDKGIIPIKDICDTLPNSDNRIDIKVKSRNGTIHTSHMLFNSGYQSIMALTLKNGMMLRGTPNHPVLTINNDFMPEWKRLDSIKKNDMVAVDISTDNSLFGNNNDLVEARMLGGMISEGYITSKNRIGIINSDKNMIYPVKQFFDRIGIGTRASINLRKQNDACYEYVVSSNTYFEEFKAKYEYTESASTKTVPACVLAGTKEYQQEFIKYLFEGDGSVQCDLTPYKPKDRIRIIYSSHSKSLIMRLQIMLLTNFGIFNTISYNKARKCYTLAISGDDIIRYREEIGFVSDRKNNLLNQIPRKPVSHSSYHHVPLLAKYIRSHDSRIKRDIFSRQELNKYIDFIDSSVAQYCISIMNHYVLVPVNSIGSYPQKELVYSVRVDSDCHSFSANGFINHNTEMRLSKSGEACVRDTDSSAVFMKLSFDVKNKLPELLPSRLPILLINGSKGLAYGYNVSWLPHNPTEAIKACLLRLENQKCTVKDIRKVMPGPDFPSGGILVDRDDTAIESAYETGFANLTLTSRYTIRQATRGRHLIDFYETPYGIARSGDKSILSGIGDFADKHPEYGISDVKNLSGNEHDCLIEVTVKSGINAEAVAQALVAPTSGTMLTQTMSYRQSAVIGDFERSDIADATGRKNMLRLTNAKPRDIDLIGYIDAFIDFRRACIINSAEFEMDKALRQKHLIDGMLLALVDIDEVISIVRRSQNKDTAAKNLKKRFKLDDEQAAYILGIPLARLTRSDKISLEDNSKKLNAKASELKKMLSSDKNIREEIKKQLETELEHQNLPRRTTIVSAKGKILAKSNKESKEQQVQSVTIAMASIDGDAVANADGETIFNAASSLTVSGKTSVYMNAAGEICQTDKSAPQLPVQSLRDVDMNDIILVVFRDGSSTRVPARDLPSGKYAKFVKLAAGMASFGPNGSKPVNVAMATSDGKVKVLDSSTLTNRPDCDVMKVASGAQLIAACPVVDGSDQSFVFVTSKANLLIFPVSSVNSQGRTSAGVAGIKLASGVKIITAAIALPTSSSVVTSTGTSIKVSKLSDFPAKGRGTLGVRCHTMMRGETEITEAFIGENPVAKSGTKAFKLPEITKRDARGERIEGLGSLKFGEK